MKNILEQFLRKNFNDIVILDPCLDENYKNTYSIETNVTPENRDISSDNSDNNTNIVWTLDDEYQTKINVTHLISYVRLQFFGHFQLFFL